jgi:dynactin complex subunit
MPEEILKDVAKLDGIITGVRDDVKKMKRNLKTIAKELKKAHEDSLERIARTKSTLDALNWKKHHIKDNDESKE